MNPEQKQEFPNASEIFMCEKYGHPWLPNKRNCPKCGELKYTKICKSGCGCEYPNGSGSHEGECVWEESPLSTITNKEV